MDYTNATNPNFPSIFIRLPRLTGTKWVPADIVEVIDKYGDIKEVSVRKDIRGDQYAIVHFNEWYPEGMMVATAVYRGKPVKIRALYRKHFNLVMFNAPNKEPNSKVVAVQKAPVAPGICFGNPGQLSALEFLAQKQLNSDAASMFMQTLNRRTRSDSNVSDITMEDDFEYQRTSSHYYRHYPLEEGEII